jgi:hypothetical protein
VIGVRRASPSRSGRQSPPPPAPVSFVLVVFSVRVLHAASEHMSQPLRTTTATSRPKAAQASAGGGDCWSDRAKSKKFALLPLPRSAMLKPGWLFRTPNRGGGGGGRAPPPRRPACGPVAWSAARDDAQPVPCMEGGGCVRHPPALFACLPLSTRSVARRSSHTLLQTMQPATDTSAPCALLHASSSHSRQETGQWRTADLASPAASAD